MKDSLRDMSGMIRAAPDVAEESINHMIFTCPPAIQCWALSTIPLTREFFCHKTSILIWTSYFQGPIVEESWRKKPEFFFGLYGISGKCEMKNYLMDEISLLWILQTWH